MVSCFLLHVCDELCNGFGNQICKRLMPLWVRLPIFPVSKDFGSFSHFLFDLLIQAGEEFTNRSSIYRLIRQCHLKAWLAGELFVTTHLDSLIFAFEAQHKSHFLLRKREPFSIGS